jgi:hypothetical protein
MSNQDKNFKHKIKFLSHSKQSISTLNTDIDSRCYTDITNARAKEEKNRHTQM